MKMTIESFWPNNALLLGFVEIYRLVEFAEEVEGVTIANGRVDAVIILRGRLEWFDEMDNAYISAPSNFFFPFSKSGTRRLRIAKDTKLLNIKFYPHLLTRPIFDNYLRGEFLDFESIFTSDSLRNLNSSLEANSGIVDFRIALDYFLDQSLKVEKTLDWDLISELVDYISKSDLESNELSGFADKQGLSLKTLERHFKKYTGLSTKAYRDLLRFQHAARQINTGKSYEHGDLLEALGSGYYDQSHFVKACRKIAGVSPKELFTHLPRELTDFAIID